MRKRVGTTILGVVILTLILSGTVMAEECAHEYRGGTGACFWCDTLCSHKKNEYDSAWYTVSEKEPTCEKEGNASYKFCTICYTRVPSEVEIYEPLGHDYIDGICTRCGGEEGILCKHENVHEREAKEPTCVKNGHAAYKLCLTCRNYIPEDYEIYKALGHEYVDEICTRCGEEYADEAKIGDIGYATLEEAVAQAKDGDIVHLLSNAYVEETLVIDKSITIIGQNETNGGSRPRIGSGEKSTIIVQGNVEVTITNVYIWSGYKLYIASSKEAETAQAPEDAATIIIGDGAVVLNLQEVEINGGGGIVDGWYTDYYRYKCILIPSGDNSSEKVTINFDKCLIFMDKVGDTAIITFRPVEINITGQQKTVASVIGANFIHFKKGSAGSVVQAKDTVFRRDVRGTEQTGDYGFFVFEENNITVKLENTYYEQDGESLFYWMDNTYSGIQVTVDDKSIILNNYRDSLVENYDSTKNSVLLYGTYMEDKRENKLYLPQELCAHVNLGEEECTDCGMVIWDGVTGDVNVDGTLDTSDAQAIFNHFMGIASLSEDMITIADVNGDGNVDTTDAQAVFNMFMGII